MEIKILDNDKITIDGVTYVKDITAKWEPKGGIWCVGSGGAVAHGSPLNSSRLFGVEFQSKEQAKRCAKKMQRHNWLLQLREEFCPEWEAEWNDKDESKYFIYYNHKEKKWDWNYETSHHSPSQVYFPEEACDKIIEMLNNGELELPNFLE